jgi:uncharacterized protein (DUF983 family)
MKTDHTTSATTWTNAPEPADPPERRQLWSAMRHGFRGRCPHCGEGRLFARYLKTVDACSVCGEDMSHHRADDLPPYLTILVVGHIVVPLVLFVEKTWHPDVILQLAVWIPLTLALTLLLIQPIKGAVVGLQWANRMHGFDGQEDEHDARFVAGTAPGHGR